MAVVTLPVFGIVGYLNQQGEMEEIDRALNGALKQGGMHRMPSFGFGGGGQDSEDAPRSNVPVYCVTVLMDGTLYPSDSNTASMDSDVASAAVAQVLDAQEASGMLDEYKLFYKSEVSLAGSTRIAFASADTYLSEIAWFYLRMLGVWAALMVLIFVITLFLSRLVTKPVSQAWETQQQFIADASHELKTPLTVIMADASILAQDPQKTVGEQEQWVRSIETEAERMQQLTESMLTLAQTDAGVDMSQVMSAVDFSDVVQGCTLQFEAVAFERGLMIEEQIEPGLTVMGDAVRLERLLKTLLENACKYSEKPGTIDVTLARVKNSAQLSVHNAGEPIPEEDLPHLFDRFYRSDKARVREGETASFGLGLSIAKATVELHGGKIDAQSNENGTTFTVSLPLVK